MHCTSVGKAILAFLPEERINDIIRRTRFERFTNRTIATAEALRTEIEKTRRRGYAVDDEELEEGSALHRRSAARCATTAGGRGQRLGAFVPRDGAEAAFDRQPSAAVRSRNLGGYGLYCFCTEPIALPGPLKGSN